MSGLDRSSNLEIEEDLPFQRRAWIMQRVAWVIMVLLTVAALLGGFGKGIVSTAHLTSHGSALSVEYERFTRLYSPGYLEISVAQSASLTDSTVELWLDRDWLDKLSVNAITPEPVETRTASDRVIYTFRLEPLSRPVHFRFEFISRNVGRLAGRVGMVNGPDYAFSQFGYP
ncbi:MAG: hypothetical protein ABIS03_02180 [Gemmatimonadaceae bacterium]